MGTDDQNQYGHVSGDLSGSAWSFSRGFSRITSHGTIRAVAARAEIRDLSNATAHLEPAGSAPELFRAGHLALFLAERKDAGARGLETSGGARLPGFQAQVGGLVENPVELSLADIEQLGTVEDITMHHCIQGWSGIAKWGGIPMKTLIELVRPKPEARVVAFFSFGEALYGGTYYDTQSMDNRPEGGMPARLRNEWTTAPRGVWRASAAARRESTWLQDGQVDRTHRIHRVGETVGQGRRWKERGRRIFRSSAQHLTSDPVRTVPTNVLILQSGSAILISRPKQEETNVFAEIQNHSARDDLRCNRHDHRMSQSHQHRQYQQRPRPLCRQGRYHRRASIEFFWSHRQWNLSG